MTTVACTSGYLVKRTDLPSVRQILTAGHCLAKAGGVGEVWEHDANGPNIGTAQTNTFAEHPALGGTHDSDVGLIGIQASSLPTTKNQFIAGNSGGPIVAAVDSYFLHVSQDEGDLVCRYGVTSKRDCGLVIEEDAANRSCLNPDDTGCKWIERTWVVDFDSCGGDSGGPVFLYAYPPGSVHVAYGTHVHSTLGCSSTSGSSWYSPYDIGRNEWQSIHPTIQWNICLTPSC
jgi:hypothetical protein